jgi:hypothetical protein
MKLKAKIEKSETKVWCFGFFGFFGGTNSHNSPNMKQIN